MRSVLAVPAGRAAIKWLGLALGALWLVTAPADAQLHGAQRLPLVTIPPAPDAGPPAAPAAPTGIPPVARSLLPTKTQILRDVQGTGIVIYGALTGKADSALAVLSGVFAYSQAFDRSPGVQLLFADRDYARVQALFTASAEGNPVIGIAVVTLGDSGGDVSVFYDYAGAFPASFPRLQQAMAQSGTSTEPLAPVGLGDGGTIDIPRGWRVIGQGTGSVDMLGPLGELVSLGTATPVYSHNPGYGGVQTACCDPVKSLQAVYPQIAATEQRLGFPAQQLTGIVASQPEAGPVGGEAAFVLANLSVGGRPYAYFARAEAVAGFTDPWTLTVSGAMAPQPVFADELPTLLRIWASHTANPPGFTDRLRQAAQGMDATAQMLQATITARETPDYNASASWEPVIRGLAPAEGADGGPYRLDDALAQPLAEQLSRDTGRTWRIVPLAEFK
jgi:hypothetical protein